ncbi:MAG: hypothetical protein WD342_07260 [Verrucomicrobiales bacterium]
MSIVEQIKLSEFFRQFKPTHVLGTTYTVSPVFFEANLWHQISKERLRGCVILCDRKGFQRATQEVGALRAAARAYSLVHAPVPAAFHPKVWIMIDEEKLALLCGSGNLTQSGFIDNLELFETVTLEQNGKNARLAGSILEFVQGLRSYWSDSNEATIPAARLIREMETRIRELARSLEDDGEGDVRFLSSFGGSFPDQLSELGTVERLWMAAPYFGGSLSGVRALQERLSPKETVLCPASHHGAEVDLPPAEVGELPGTRLAALKLNQKRRTLAHYKLFGFELEDGSRYSFTGSVNATHNALNGANVEAGILRRLSEDAFADLFSEASFDTTSVQAELDYETEEKKWVGFWVTGNRAEMEIVVADAYRRSLPLSSVRFDLKTSAGRFSASRDEVFTQSTRCGVRWKEFEGLEAQPAGIALVKVDGIDPDGNQVHGTALVEDYSALTSTPGQRNAFQGALALLQGEGLPDSGELAAVFSLLADTMDVEEPNEPDIVDASSSSGEESDREEASRPERAPLWPPVAREVDTVSTSAASAFGQVAWFQRVLSQFLVHRDYEESKTGGKPGTGGNEDPEAGTTSDVDSEDESERESDANIDALKKACAARWKQANDALAGLENRFRQLEITKEQKSGVLPTCIGISLVCLAVKKMILQKIDPTELGIDSNGRLAARFISIVLADRKQDDDYVRPKGSPYHNEVFPPLIEDLVERLEVEVDPKLGPVLLSFLAYCHAAPGVSFPTHEWLEFRHFVERQGHDLADWMEAATRTAEVYLINDVEDVTPARFRESLETLLELEMKSLPGWTILEETWAVARGDIPQASEETRSAFGDAWSTFECKCEQVEDTLHLFVRTSRHALFCVNKGCGGRGMKQPAFSKLRSICPVICPRCGTVQVPKILAETFFPDGTND